MPAPSQPPLLLVFTLALGLLASGCGDRGYTFSTTATYDVPALGFRADIVARGRVPSGADLSDDGTSLIVLSRLGHPPVPVATLMTSNQVAGVSSGETITCIIGTNALMILPWGAMSSGPSLKQILETAGLSTGVPAALDEAASAIAGPALGPKSTGVQSSTHVIVVKVTPIITR